MQVIGLCRFSYPAIKGFQVEHHSIEERRNYLYAPERLEERFHLFETLTLPGLRAQTAQDFDFLIVVGDCLPRQALDRLRDLTADIRQIRILSESPGEHRKVMKRILNNARTDPAQPCLQFRLDDDDAVAVDFVEQLRASAHLCPDLIKANHTVAIDFNQGFLAEFQNGTLQTMPLWRNLVSAGLGMYVQGGCKLTIMNFSHQRLGRFMPVLSFPGRPMWIRSLNGFNDSANARKGKLQFEKPGPEVRSELFQRFAIELAQA